MSLVQKDQTLVYKFKIKIKLKATYSNIAQQLTPPIGREGLERSHTLGAEGPVHG